MPDAIRVLVVDDAVVIRRLLTDVLDEDPDIEVAGTAANGRIALQKIEQLSPDVVVLDMEMGELDGLGTLRALRETSTRIPTIMFSTLTERGAAATLDALALGASDYVTKPANVGSVAASLARVREELVPKIKALGTAAGSARRAEGSSPRPGAPVRSPTPAPTAPAHRAVEVVVIGVSTGGPNALAEIIPALPAEFPVPVLIVQHMPTLFTRLLAERLDAASALHVQEAAHGDPIVPGSVLVAPGDHHMVVAGDHATPHVELNQNPPESSCRPAVDPLFRTAATRFGPGTLAVVLTGMGHDGTRGAAAVRDAHGVVIVQDQATSVVWGMPGSVVHVGLADAQVPVGLVASTLCERVGTGHVPVASAPVVGG